MEPKLTIELVPSTAWFYNLRSILSVSDWDALRHKCYAQASSVCQICGGKGDRWPVECHEIWMYDDTRQLQTLTGLIALCPKCHQVKHIGLAMVRGKTKEVMNHLQKVNEWNAKQTAECVRLAFAVHQKRSLHLWETNTDRLKTQGVHVPVFAQIVAPDLE